MRAAAGHRGTGVPTDLIAFNNCASLYRLTPNVSRARSVRTEKLSPDIFESVKTRAISVLLGSLDFTHSFRRYVKGFRKPVKQTPFAVADNTVFFQTSFVLVEIFLFRSGQFRFS